MFRWSIEGVKKASIPKPSRVYLPTAENGFGQVISKLTILVTADCFSIELEGPFKVDISLMFILVERKCGKVSYG